MNTRHQEVVTEGKASTLWDIKGMYASRSLLEKIDSKGVQYRVHTNERILMPEFDIANLGKHRSYGTAIHAGDWWEVVIKCSSEVASISPGIPANTSNSLPESPESVKGRAVARAKRNIRRVVNANHCKVLWTLTMAPPSVDNNSKWKTVALEPQRDYDAVRKLWKAFLKRFHRAGERFPWIVVLERHDSEDTSNAKRGCWHLHFTTPSILPVQQVRERWPHGIVNFRDFRKPLRTQKGDRIISDPGNYISKYAGKSFGEGGEYKKSYTCSRDVIRPKKYDIGEFVDIVKRDALTLELKWTNLLQDVNGAVYGISLRYHNTGAGSQVRQ